MTLYKTVRRPCWGCTEASNVSNQSCIFLLLLPYALPSLHSVCLSQALATCTSPRLASATSLLIFSMALPSSWATVTFWYRISVPPLAPTTTTVLPKLWVLFLSPSSCHLTTNRRDKMKARGRCEAHARGKEDRAALNKASYFLVTQRDFETARQGSREWEGNLAVFPQGSNAKQYVQVLKIFFWWYSIWRSVPAKDGNSH